MATMYNWNLNRRFPACRRSLSGMFSSRSVSHRQSAWSEREIIQYGNLIIESG